MDGEKKQFAHTYTFSIDCLSFMVNDEEYFVYTDSCRDTMPKDATLVGHGVQLNFIGNIEIDDKMRRVKMIHEGSPLANVYINRRQEWYIEPYEENK